jgi:glycine dehydrogenase
MSTSFIPRHIGPQKTDVQEMLASVNANSLDELVAQTIPQGIRLKNKLMVPEGISEYEYAQYIRKVAAKNKPYKSYIGLGYYNCIIPPVIQRNVLENPGWYTAYTPYQAEIAQGRLEGLLNFQTMVSDLTAMPIANASLLDEATAAAEAMMMFYNTRTREAIKNNANSFFVDEDIFPQTLDVLKTRAKSLSVELVVGGFETTKLNEKYFGAMVQYPTAGGAVKNYRGFVEESHRLNIPVAVATDLLSLSMLTPPGEWGADVVFGSAQRFGVPMGYGGPHAAFFASKEDFKRSLPGRIIGVSVDRNGNRALRMALQTREQHIRRDKATSNICTAQALLAIMSGMYAVYHGPKGIRYIGEHTHKLAVSLADALKQLGIVQENASFFDTLKLTLSSEINSQAVKLVAEKNNINFRYINQNTIGISLDETTSENDVKEIVSVFAEVTGKPVPEIKEGRITIAEPRKSPYLTHPVFSLYHSETSMMRYLKSLENKDLSLTHSMISLGSCTMKLNAASELYPISIPEFANIHPFVPANQAEGYREVFAELEKWLADITGFSGVSLQPNSGAQGEYAGLLVIQAYHESRGEAHRNIALIPSSAHGTNPASAVVAGLEVVVVKCDNNGNIDIADLKEKAEKHKNNLSCLMVTYPSTHGVFEEGITEVTKIIHDNGGQVYMDGANMNAQVGLTSPGNIGADVCHLNLHKTFAIPHGGGGPGMGPIAVAKHLMPFLPSHPVISTGGDKGIHAVSAAPWGSALILLISYGYIKMLGNTGITESTKHAILNANYIKNRLEKHYPVLYAGKNGRIAHEMILDCRNFKRTAQVEVEDIAKRLMDYGFHAPTVSFPVAGTLMVEPTESESKEELDRYCDAMISIREEITEIENGKADVADNVLKNAPHTAPVIISDSWNHSYSREKAAYPLAWLKTSKFWPSVGRVDNAYGDRNLICTCPSTEEYAEPATV